MPIWEGRFEKELDTKTNDFNSSIKFDKRMYKEDITGSVAHVTMLAKQGIIEETEKEVIVQELEKISEDIELEKIEIDLNAEDIHSFIESELISRIGDTGKKLHTARSRNDQVALDIRMYLKEETKAISDMLKKLISAFIVKAEENTKTVMPGYTHLQRAQPITFAHHLMAYVEMFSRDIERLSDAYKRLNILPLGSGALGGTTYNIDRDYVADVLEFEDITKNSLDGVSDRDFCIELMSICSTIMMHLSRISEEIIMWCSWEFKFIELDDAFATGSSMMPQKKNPDIAELIRGKTGRVYGNLMAILTVMKGLPLAYNKDMQEDKEAIFDSLDTVKICITTFIPMLETMKVLKENMKQAALQGFINATDCADYLVKKGMPFRDAYKCTAEVVKYCITKNKTLDTLSLEEYKEVNKLFEEDIYETINLMNCIEQRKTIGGPAEETVIAHINMVKEKLQII